MIFKDSYFFLSNFYLSPISIEINGNTYSFTNAEAAFQRQKNLSLIKNYAHLKGWEAKKYGDNIPITTENWNKEQLVAMAKVLHAKFSNQALLFKLKLIQEPIINDNYWGDIFWGVCEGIGNNYLGKLLMNIRDNSNDFTKLMLYVRVELIPNL